ncbi:MAG: VCBS repeat-containing protein, partial [bacterium]|nr:VCBS repeat-containing protein [bacterium]
GSLAAGDFDEDGDLDLAAGFYQYGFNYVAVLLNDGTGQFTVTSAPLPWAGASLQAVGTADMNGDGHLDMLGGKHRFCVAGSISFGNGDGTFGDFADIDFQPIEHFTDIGDLDGDGDLDIVANADQNNTQLTVLLNNGAGTFSAGSAWWRVGDMVRLGDVDGDGVLDAVMLADDEYKAAVLAGRGDGTLREAEMVVETELTRMVLEDLDGDGDQDMAACLDWGPDPGGIVVALNQTPGEFGDP